MKLCRQVVYRPRGPFSGGAGIEGAVTLRQWICRTLPPCAYRRVEVSRGFIDRVTLNADLLIRHAGALFRAHPVTVVTLENKRPWPGTTTRRADDPASPFHPLGWIYPGSGDGTDYGSGDATIPEEIWLLAREYRDKRFAESAADSRLWLHWACLAYGRIQAGLPFIDPSDLIPRS